MVVLMLGWELPPKISGGLGTACAGLLKCLDSADELAINFVLPSVDGDENACAAQLIGLGPQWRLAHRDRPREAYGAYVSLAQLYQSCVQSMHGAFGHYDVIHAHDWMTFGAAVYLKRASGKKLVLHVHSTEYDRAGDFPDPAILHIERTSLHSADQIIAVSVYTKTLLVDRYGLDVNKISVVYNWIECAPISRAAPASRKVVSFIGRMTSQKGPEHFIESAFDIIERRSDVDIVMAGDGDLLALMKSIVAASGMQHRFSFPGFVSQQEVLRILSGSALYVMPSRSEPFGIGAIDAISKKVPIVASHRCGFIELFPQVCAIDPEDIDGMTEACLKLLDDPLYAKQMADAAYAALGEVKAENVRNDLLEVYRRVLSERCHA